MKRKLNLLLFVSSFLISVVAMQCFAASPAFIIQRGDQGQGSIEYNAYPGAVIIDDFIEVVNLDEERYIEVALQTKGLSNHESTTRPFPAEWIDFGDNKIKLDPLGNISFSYTITIPEDAEEKIYRGILRASLVDYEGKESEGVSINTAQGLRLVVNVDRNNKVVTEQIKEEGEERVVSVEDHQESLKDTKEKVKPIETTEAKNRFFNWIQENILYIVLIVVLLLILKVAINSKSKKGNSKSKKK